MSRSKQTTTITPNNPSWVTDQVRGVSNQIAGLTGTDPLSYVADWNPVQSDALSMAQRMGGANMFTDKAFKTLDLVGNYKAPSVSAASLLDNLDRYMNPFTDQVVDTTLAGYDRQAGTERARNLSEQAATSAFNSSRSGIQGAELDALLNMNRASTEAGLRKDAFNTGASLSADDAARRQQASMASAELAMAKQNQGLAIAGLLADMGSDFDATERADIATMLGLGNTLFDIENARARAPLDVTGSLAGMTGSLPYNLFSGQTQTATSSPSALSMLGTGLLGVGSLMSGGALGGLTGLMGGLGSLGGAAGGLKTISNLSKGLAGGF